MKRRGNHEGSPFQRKNGLWMDRVRLAGKRISVYGKTEKEVRQKVRRLVADHERGVAPVTGNLSVAQFLDRWLEDVIKPAGKLRTYQSYEYHSRLHIKPALGRVKLRQLQAPQVQRWCAELRKTGLAPKTVRLAHGVLRSALEQAVQWRLVGENVARLVRPPRAQQAERKTLSAEQVRRLWQAAEGTRWRPLLVITAGTGLRQNEVLGLQWGDVDFERGTLTVQRQLQRDKTFRELKTNSRRPLDLAPSELAVLREHQRRQLELRRAMGDRWEDHDLIFCTDRGRPLGWRNVTREYTRFKRLAGLPAVSFHGLRHSNATIMAEAGVPLKVIQERLGHSDSRTTLGFYGHATRGMGREAAQKLEDHLHRP